MNHNTTIKTKSHENCHSKLYATKDENGCIESFSRSLNKQLKTSF